MAEEDELNQAREAVRRDARRRLVELDLTQEQLSELTRVPIRTVNRFFSGADGSWPRTNSLRGIATGLQWPPDELDRRVERAMVRRAMADLSSSVEAVLIIDLGPHVLEGLLPDEVRELQAGMEAHGLRMVNEIKARTPGRGFQLGVAS